MGTGTIIKHIDVGQLKYLTVALPPHHEQRAIAAFLDRETAKIDDLVRKKERLIELLRERRTAMITRAVLRGLGPVGESKESGVPWIRSVPDKWRPVKIKRLFRHSKRQGYSGEAILSVYREYGVIEKSSRDDNFNRTPEDLNSYQLVQPGDLVINKMKGWQGSLGVSELRGITSPDYLVYSPRHDESPRYLHYLLRASVFTDVYLAMSNGIRPGQWRLEPEVFAELLLFLPPVDEQQAIGEYLARATQPVDDLVVGVQKAIDRLRELRTALISAAVAGNIDVRPQALA